MMKFDPPDLQKQLDAALRAVSEYCDHKIEIDWAPFNSDEPLDPAKYEDAVITLQEEIQVALPHDDSRTVTVENLLELRVDVEKGELDDSHQSFSSPSTLIMRVEPISDPAWRLSYFTGSDDCSRYLVSTTATDRGLVTCSIRRGITAFSLGLVRRDEYDRYNPPLTPDDLFVEVRGGALRKSERLEWLNAYLFELSASHGFAFRPAPHPFGHDDSFDPEEEGVREAIGAMALRPLLSGPGLAGLLELYANAVAVQEPDLRLLALVRALEWVATTVVRAKGYEEVRRRLLSPNALAPDAKFIADLLELVEAQRVFKSDAEALRLTVETCCDPVLLAKLAPATLGKLAKITEAAAAQEKRDALAQLGKCLASTRNVIAHAKPNYRATGDECPFDELPALARCADVAAQQAIRWYALSDPTLRV